MNFSLYIFKHEFKTTLLDSHILTPPEKAIIRKTYLCNTLPPSLDPHILYICPTKAMKNRYLEEGLSFICIGSYEDLQDADKTDYLLFPETEDLIEIANETEQIFFRYLEWEDQLIACLEKDASLHEMVDISFPFINNPIYIQGASFVCLLNYLPKTKTISPSYEKYRSENSESAGSVLPFDAISELISDPDYNNAIHVFTPSIYIGNEDFRCLYYNIRSSNVVIARLMFNEILQPFSEKDYAIIQTLGIYVGKFLLRKGTYGYDRPMQLDYILQNLLAHKFLQADKILTLLQHYQWDEKDEYRCMVLKFNSLAQEESTLAPIALNISAQLQSNIYTVFNGRIIMIFNISRINQEIETYIHSIMPLLRDNLLLSSISSSYHDFKDLYYYYHQALMIEGIGQKKENTQWCFRFSDFHMDYILEKCLSKSKMQVIIPNGLKKLIIHDKEKGTDFVNLLRVYLNAERSITETSKNAFLHRNTCMYRIKHLLDILQMDLDIPDNRLILQLALKAIQSYES